MGIDEHFTREHERLVRIAKTLHVSEKHLSRCEQSFNVFRPAYHNELHCFSTALTFYDLATMANVSARARRDGLLAAIYHDAGHLALEEDSDNIEVAQQWLRSCGEKNIGPASRLIKSTCNGRRPRGKVEKLLHDADILQTVKGADDVNHFWQQCLSKEKLLFIGDRESHRWVKGRLLTKQGRKFAANR